MKFAVKLSDELFILYEASLYNVHIVACRRIKAFEFDKFVSIELWDLSKEKYKRVY